MKAKLKTLEDEKLRAIDAKMQWEQKFYDSQNELESVKSENEKLNTHLSALQNENATFKTKLQSENALRNTEEKINSFQSTLAQLDQESRLLEERKMQVMTKLNAFVLIIKNS